jgi:hypothetical protein
MPVLYGDVHETIDLPLASVHLGVTAPPAATASFLSVHVRRTMIAAMTTWKHSSSSLHLRTAHDEIPLRFNTGCCAAARGVGRLRCRSAFN